MRLLTTVYRGASARLQNVPVSAQIATFGRFAAYLAKSTVCVQQNDDLRWFIETPPFRTIHSFNSEIEATESLSGWLASNVDGWTIDAEIAKSNAIDHAKARHDRKCSESANYARNYA